MAISVFPAGGGEFVTNDFVVDMNNSTNNVVDLGRTYAAGAYELTFASGDSTFDIYTLDSDGASVGYTNNTTLITTSGFTTLAILGVSTTEKITFSFSGASNNSTSEGDAPGAGAYLVSINPADLPNADDTATVIGGNFATDIEITFESGTVSLPAKNITRTDSTELIVTRPDSFDPALDPWDVKAINPGVTPPTGTNAHILAGTVDAGAVPVFQTTSPLPSAFPTQAYAATVVATDADGSVTYSITAGSVPAGLSFNGATGVISGTATGSSETFTVQALDEGGNSNDREFTLSVLAASGGVVTTDGNFTVHTFESSDDFILYENKAVEYVVAAGGGGGGYSISNLGGGGGGAGGVLSALTSMNTFAGNTGSRQSALNLTAGTYPVGIGAAGNGGFGSGADRSGNKGGSTTFSNITATGGGGGDYDGLIFNAPASIDGGSGGGARAQQANNTTGDGGAGIANQGFHGGGGGNSSFVGGGGGGATSAGAVGGNGNGTGGTGISLVKSDGNTTYGFIASGGQGGRNNSNTATPNNKASGGNAGRTGTNDQNGGAASSGLVLIRYE